MPTNLRRPLLSSLVCAFAAGLLAIALLHLFPFLAHINGLDGNPPTPELWAGFSEAAFIFGALAGLSSLLLLKRLRVIAAILIIGAAIFALFLAAFIETMSSLHNGDSLIALLMLSPIYLVVGLGYALVVSLSIALLVVGASVLKNLLQLLPEQALFAAAGIGFAASLFVLFPSLRTSMSWNETLPEVAPPPTPEPPPMECPPLPFVEEARRAIGIRVVSAERLPAESRVALYLVGVRGEPTSALVDSAQDALHGRLQCVEAGRIWSASFIVAAPRAVTLVLRVKRQPDMTLEHARLVLRQTILNETDGYLNADPKRPGGFVTQLGFASKTALPEGAIKSVDCVPESADLECSIERIAVAETGVYPKIEDVKVEWAAKVSAPRPHGAAAPR